MEEKGTAYNAEKGRRGQSMYLMLGSEEAHPTNLGRFSNEKKKRYARPCAVNSIGHQWLSQPMSTMSHSPFNDTPTWPGQVHTRGSDARAPGAKKTNPFSSQFIILTHVSAKTSSIFFLSSFSHPPSRQCVNRTHYRVVR